MKRVADNPDAYLIRRDARKCFKSIEDNNYPAKDSKIRQGNNAPVAGESVKTNKDLVSLSGKEKKEKKDNVDKPSNESTKAGKDETNKIQIKPKLIN